ncbi:MAG: hypothetical protein HFI90_11980 [Clostridia bacterium]|nr:hypothetical protein [Clostridia bacterium]
MYHTFEGKFQEYLINLEEIVSAAWEESQERRLVERRRNIATENLLKLIPPKKRRRAEHILENYNGTYLFENSFYYQYGVKDGTRLLKLLGVL